MAKILDMPKLSPTMEEGVLQTWHKKEGDAIEVDDLLAEVETDKATMEFRAFDKGTLLKILVPPGTTVKLGQAVAIVGSPGEDTSALEAGAGPGAAASANAGANAGASAAANANAGASAGANDGAGAKVADKRAAPTMRPAAAARPKPKGSLLSRTEDEGESAPAALAVGGGGERVLASPYVRKVARERGLDLSHAQGSGEHGRIMPSDLDAIGAGGPAPDTAKTAGIVRAPETKADALATSTLAAPEARPLSPMRKTIARRLVQSKQTVPHFYLTIDVNAGALVSFRESLNAELAPKSGEPAVKISLNDLLIKACASALVAVPECNAQYTDEALLIHRRVDISVAVAVPDGLVTPVVRDADKKSVVAIAKEVRELATRARAKKLKPEEFTEGTFSISNLGMFGIDSFSAVINPPEGAILAVGQVRDEPVVKDGVVSPGKKLSMTLSCDHRVIDGAVGAAFLAELRSLLERPMRILTG